MNLNISEKAFREQKKIKNPICCFITAPTYLIVNLYIIMYSMYVCYSIYCVMHILPKNSLKTGSTRCGKKESQISTVEGFTQQSVQ